MIPTRSNEEILTYSVLSMAVYNYMGEVESTDVNELAKLSHSVELRVHKQQREKEENGMIKKVKMRKKIVETMRRNIQRKEVFAAKL